MKNPNGKLQQNSSFFDSLSLFYDEMVGFEQALERRKLLLKGILNPQFKTAADLGCGTGMDAIALASAGLKVDAFDQSKGMLEMAEKNASGRGVDVNFHHFPFDRIPASKYKGYDLAVSLGNSLANLIPARLEKTASIISRMLNPEGMLVIQILNYRQIVKKGERIINITEKGENCFVRFYDFHPDFLTFNVLAFKKTNPSERRLFSSPLYPYSSSQLKNALSAAGFRRIRAFGNLKLEKYEPAASSDLVIMAEK